MNNQDKSRRSFLAALLKGSKGIPELNLDDNDDKIKMLTADGKLVEISKSVYQKVAGHKKATNSEIYEWMDNPSKKESL